ncbi:galactose mutarotase-like enzyme [Rhizobium mesoamericanum]|uniref:aldose 1-epimerase family protein n=1 Tax=Rhizobium mesoamericanum TaxID=1079800 RepID=UPI00277F8846|nr:aldose 1-epimerase family protein [Rhizobium mesoamericanum]MDQ0561409.1 galactose mutarotase-like enzyme [Rhizobium mesoamericanum]
MPSLTRIANPHLTVDVSSLGAEMQALETSDGRSWLWNGDAAFWGGRSPILFPIVGKAPDDMLTIEGQSFPMGQHGFARRSEFVLAFASATTCRYELASSPATMAVFPFDFLLAVEHTLQGRALTVAAEVTNRDQRAMPFGLGFHPAFLWPLPGAAGQDHVVTLDNRSEPGLVRLDGGLISPAKLASPFKEGRLVLNHGLFEQDAMIFPEDAGKGLRYGVEGGPTMHFIFENLPNLALWQKPGAPFICIEPWHGTAAEKNGPKELAERPYSLTLPPGEMGRFAFTVEIFA